MSLRTMSGRFSKGMRDPILQHSLMMNPLRMDGLVLMRETTCVKPEQLTGTNQIPALRILPASPHWEQGTPEAAAPTILGERECSGLPHNLHLLLRGTGRL